MFKQFQCGWSGLLIYLLLATNVQASTTDRKFCRNYARDLMNSPQQAQHKLPMCQKKQPHWRADKMYHMQWCLSVSKEVANKKRYRHNKLVNLCNDHYKLLMVDHHRLANLLLSVDETIRLPLASQALKTILLQRDIQNPYRQFYPEIYKAIKNKRFTSCDLYSLVVDIDDSVATKEWLLTLDEGCLTAQQTGHVWLIQQLKDAYYVLFEGEGNTLTLRYSKHNGYKNIAMSMRLSAAEETKQRCGSIKAEWYYVAGRYLPFKGEAEEQGDCLPEYHLPDYLQGENTLSLSEKEWQEEMTLEEKKRIALFAPYKKSLGDYIPQWIKRMEQQVPTRKEAVGIASSLMASTSKQEKEEKEEKEEKSFIQRIRDFFTER